MLAIKPQMLDEAAPALNGSLGPETLIISILAGKTIGDLRRRLPAAGAIVRAMPNLPASIGRGATGAAANDDGERGPAPDGRCAARAASASSNGCRREDLIDAVTALSGSGPAYVFHLVECLAEAGAAAGLPADLAAAPRARHGDGRGRAAVPERPAAGDSAPERDLARRHHRRGARSADGAIRTA